MPTWLIALDRHFPIRYLTLLAASLALAGGALGWALYSPSPWLAVVAALGAAGLVIGIGDLRQTRHALLRNYPVIGHLRFLFEWIRPEIRQYFLESDREAVPFSRQQRSLVYQRSKDESDKRPFGTQLDVHLAGYEWINHSLQPSQLPSHDFRVVIGGSRCHQPYSASLFNISAMSFGALSANAIMALNGGARRG
ncbi:MAG: FMN-binding glutamate synthase family protein, partial [Aquabacterium sp.]|nr:FMN-binding glutamate synthase family protein [Aquabacterium sp.]